VPSAGFHDPSRADPGGEARGMRRAGVVDRLDARRCARRGPRGRGTRMHRVKAARSRADRIRRCDFPLPKLSAPAGPRRAGSSRARPWPRPAARPAGGELSQTTRPASSSGGSARISAFRCRRARTATLLGEVRDLGVGARHRDPARRLPAATSICASEIPDRSDLVLLALRPQGRESGGISRVGELGCHSMTR